MRNMKKEKTLKQLKKDLDVIFSKFIRLRDSLKYDPEGVLGRCVTCGRIKEWKYMDCGHYIKRQHLSTRYDEKNCNLQCKHCNAFEQGANEIYKLAIDEKYGDGTSEMLEIKKHNKSKLDRFSYIVLIKEYKEKFNQLNVG
jgi:hypothetical protein